jgi:Zinc carboxypeptidase
MSFRQCCVAVAVTLTLPGLLRAQSAPAPMDLGRAWDAEHLQLPAPPLVRHPDVIAVLQRLQQSAPDLIRTEPIGQSVEGRSINHVWLGRGSLKVLLWSQMHGDEPTATVALLDVLDYVRRHRDEPFVGRLLDRLELHMVPMLNPDGAERFQRRNAQGIDINRDALLLQSPEGLALKNLRDRLNPPLGFNLHNQNWRTSVGKTGQAATISLLAVSFDEARSDNAGRIRAKKVCAVLRDALEPFIPGGMARYDDAFEVRAFGDNLTKWGTSVVLIETGAYPGPAPDRMLVRVNFVGLLTAIDALASGEIDRANPARYESLPMNDSMLLHTIVSNALIVTGTGVAPFKGDIGIGANRSIRTASGRRSVGLSARIEDIGDLRVYGALERIDAGGLVAAPIRRSGLKVGDTIRLDDHGTKGPSLAVGQPAAVALLKREESGKYRVERIVRVE